MVEERIQRLEQQYESLSSGMEQVLRQMMELTQSARTREESTSVNQGQPRREATGGNHARGEGNGGFQPRSTKLDFLKDDGVDDLTAWLLRAE
ncbi:hypothetical protein L484_026065 [Morus notabilis]|uniref:Uncharacterized protein n=1 Tax=Morus notabilis TaxID=981085 RepID=W9RIH8_9ROSA|nr:hypothetical protein L484_026065 [Morus notabilis]